MEDPAAAIRKDDYKLLHALLEGPYASVPAVQALTKHLDRAELVQLISNSSLLQESLAGSGSRIFCLCEEDAAIEKHFLDLCPNAQEIITKDDCALLLYALERAPVGTVRDLINYLTDSSVLQSVITQHCDKILQCLTQIDPEYDSVSGAREVLQRIMSICPDNAELTEEVLTRGGQGYLLHDDEDPPGHGMHDYYPEDDDADYDYDDYSGEDDDVPADVEV